MMQVVCCQLAVRLETGTLGLTTERTSDGAWVESSVSSACLVRCVALELRGEVLAFLFIMYKPDPETRFGGWARCTADYEPDGWQEHPPEQDNCSTM